MKVFDSHSGQAVSKCLEVAPKKRSRKICQGFSYFNILDKKK